MAHPLPPGPSQAEAAFLCEMELVTIVPRQRLDSISLLSGRTPQLRPPHRADLPLWLALLLKRQRRANIVPPPWLHPASLSEIINHETKHDPDAFSPPPPPPARGDSYGNSNRSKQTTTVTNDPVLSPPFLPSCTAAAPAGHLPYHWLEISELLLTHAPDDMAASAGEIRSLLRDLVEVRAAKMRGSITGAANNSGTGQLGDVFGIGGGGVVNLRGVGAMELAENRGFVLGVVDGMRRLGASAEATRREEEEERREDGDEEENGSDDDMGL